MRTIWRFDITEAFNFETGTPKVRATLDLPEGARVVDMRKQKRFPKHMCIWVELDVNAVGRHVEFAIVGTGHEIPDGWNHVGTWHDEHGFVWHLYREPE